MISNILDIGLPISWIIVMLAILLPFGIKPEDKRYRASLFQGISSLFLITGILLQRFAGLSYTGVGLIMIPTALFMFTAGFLHLRNRRHN